MLAYLPVETVIRERQQDYYQALAAADAQANAAPFIDFMLSALHDAINEATITDQVTDQVAILIQTMSSGELNSSELMQALGLTHRPTFRENYLNPALTGGWVERTQPDSPRSPTQRYRLTPKGRQWLQQQVG